MNAEDLASWLKREFSNAQVRHVLNWGGFVNHSYTIQDGSRKYHLKLSKDPQSIAKFERWRRVHTILEERYRAPRLIQSVEYREIGFAGLLFEHLESKTADLVSDFDLVTEMIQLAAALGADRDLRSLLESDRLSKTYADYFVGTYIDRFTADLEGITAAQLDLLSPSLLTWMETETALLRDLACDTAAFQHEAKEPVHGDLHEGNVLITTNSWYVVDWDDLAIGDPAVDFAVLVWPMVWHSKEWPRFLSEPQGDLSQRAALCIRAQLLDEVIDSLADYVEAPVVPSRQAEVQAAKLAGIRKPWHGTAPLGATLNSRLP